MNFLKKKYSQLYINDKDYFFCCSVIINSYILYRSHINPNWHSDLPDVSFYDGIQKNKLCTSVIQ